MSCHSRGFRQASLPGAGASAQPRAHTTGVCLLTAGPQAVTFRWCPVSLAEGTVASEGLLVAWLVEMTCRAPTFASVELARPQLHANSQTKNDSLQTESHLWDRGHLAWTSGFTFSLITLPATWSPGWRDTLLVSRPW